MSSLFAFIRQDLRAALIASLLVLSHALLLTATKAPQEARTDDLVQSLGTTSALICVTILWVAFTILEAADGISISSRFRKSSSARDEEMGSPEEEEEEEGEGEKYIFCMTWIELGLGLLISAAWIYYHQSARTIMSAFASNHTSGLALIRIAYTAAMASLALLQLHLILSILWHAFWQGGVMTSSFWNEKTGWWVGVGKIRLGGVETRRQGDAEKV